MINLYEWDLNQDKISITGLDSSLTNINFECPDLSQKFDFGKGSLNYRYSLSFCDKLFLIFVTFFMLFGCASECSKEGKLYEIHVLWKPILSENLILRTFLLCFSTWGENFDLLIAMHCPTLQSFCIPYIVHSVVCTESKLSLQCCRHTS